MTEILSLYNAAVGEIFSERFWLPENVTWSELYNPPPGVFYPNFTHLSRLPIVTALVFLIRIAIESLFFKRLGRYLGMKDVVCAPCPPNPPLEKAFKRNKKPDYIVLQTLVEQTGLSLRKVERWFRLRRNKEKSSMLKKFAESGWRFFAYGFLQIYGIAVLWDKAWLTDQRQCWLGHPRQHVSDAIYWYYMFELSFYTSAVISIFIEVKRADFWQMFVHHIATIVLVSMSYVCNFVRIGTLVFLVHDVADPWMELAKCLKYAKKETGGTIAFVIFTLIWIVTRCYVYPKWLLYSVIFDTRALLKPFSSLAVFEALLLLLQVLHIFWTILILKIPLRALATRSLEDSRSDSELEPEEEEAEEEVQSHFGNGVSHRKTE